MKEKIINKMIEQMYLSGKTRMGIEESETLINIYSDLINQLNDMRCKEYIEIIAAKRINCVNVHYYYIDVMLTDLIDFIKELKDYE